MRTKTKVFKRWFMLSLVISFIILGSFNVMAEKLAGTWEGAIVVNGQGLEITIHFKEDADGYLATIDIPAQRIKNYALKNVKYSYPEISMDLPSTATGHFKGQMIEGRIEGEYTQGAAKGTFYLNKSKVKEAKEKGVEDISLKTETGTIYGTLQLPEGREISPVVLIIAGSGPTDRNGNSPLIGNNNSLKMLSKELAKAGYASVRYDKRGVNQSAGAVENPAEMNFKYFIDDAEGWIKKLQGDKRFTGVAVMGHSQGSLVGMVAARKAKADAFISLAGAGRPVNEVLRDQLAGLNKGLHEEAMNILQKLEEGKTVDKVSRELHSIFHPQTQPFIISYIKYDPAEEIRKMDIPVLLVQGTNDLQVKEKEARLLKKACPEAELVFIDGMNHVLKDAPADPRKNLATYVNPGLPLDEGLMENIIDFLQKVYEN